MIPVKRPVENGTCLCSRSGDHTVKHADIKTLTESYRTTLVAYQTAGLVGCMFKRNGKFLWNRLMSLGEFVPCIHACLATAVM
jgi:hypothetical protein